MTRLLLLPAATRLRRDRTAVQLGLTPDHAIILDWDRPVLSRILNLLDGTRSEAVIRREAAHLGVPDGEIVQLLGQLRSRGLLREAGSLLPRRLSPGTRRRLEPEAAALALRDLPGNATPAQVLQRRQRARVVLTGRSRLTAPVGALLASAGVGHVHPTAHGTVLGTDPTVGGVLAADTRRPYRRAVCDAIQRAAPGTGTAVVPEADADLIMLLGRPRPVPPTVFGHVLRNVRHLTGWIRDGSVLIGPLVRPGRTTCLQCVELSRQDRDTHWPILAAQLATMPGPPEPAESTLVAMGAAVAAGQILAELDGGDPETIDGTLEVRPPGVVRRRSWQPHPRCGCLRRRRRLR